MLLRKSFKARADVVELVDFVEDRFEVHGYTALLPRIQMDWLRSEDLKEEKV
jgi:hypothetical protein